MRDRNGLHPLPSLVRDLDALQLAAWSRKLTRRERRWLLELETRCARVRWVRPLLGSRSSVLAAWPYHDGREIYVSRRLRAIERIGRVRAVVAARAELASVLVRRIRALVPPMRPCPPHGKRCPPGCAECAAIWRWRGEYEVLSGITRDVAEWLYP